MDDRIFLEIKKRIGGKIEELYGIDTVYPDHLSVSRWFPGTSLPPHVDDMTDSKEEGDEWFHHRDFGIVVYLNEEFTGGETYYPNHEVDVEPKVGRLVIHPGDSNHEHGVRKVEGGTRYTLSSFWTKNIEYFDDWILKYEGR